MAENAGGIYYDIEMDVRGLLTAQQRVNQRLELMERGFDSTTRAVNNTERSMSSLSGVAVALAAALSVKQVSEYADAWATVNNKLANSLRPNEQLADVTERVFNITQQTRSSLDATASLYARLERATRQYGTSADDLAKLTTIINQGFVVSGATAQEAENAIIQLSQGLASGALRGEEFNSVNEQGNRLIVALADSMGVSIGEMRNMAAQGKLTTDVVVNGLLSQGAVIGKEFANTTTTISQALQVAGNNVTKFFGENSTVKSFAAGFRDSVITISENLETLGTALIGAAAIMGGRFAGALAMATAAQASRVKATIQGIVATRQSAQQEAAAASVTARKAVADKDAALSALNLATAEYNVAKGSAAEAFALENVIRLRGIYVATSAEAALANNALAASQAKVAATGITFANTMKVVNSVTAPLGGPIGVIAIVAAGWYLYSQRQAEARKEAIAFADTVPDVIKRLKDMNLAQAQGVRADTVTSIEAQKEAISDLKDTISGLQSDYEKYTTLARQYGVTEDQNNGFVIKARDAANELAKKRRDLDGATATLKQTEDALHLINIQVNQGIVDQMRAARDNAIAIAEAEKQASFLGGTQAFLAEKLGQSTQALKAFNSESLKINWGGKEGEKLIKQAERRLALSKLEGEAKARQQAAYDAEDAGVTDERAIKRLQDNYAATERNTQARKDQKKEDNAAASEAKKLANQQESVNQKLENLRQQSELAAGSTQELSREKAILNAQLSLGKGATQEQIALAGQYAAKTWDTANAIKAQAAAQKLLPETRENASYQQDMKDLKTALDGKRITQQQYNQTSEQLEAQHQVNLAKIRAQQTVSPMQEARGQIDPVQQLANQHAQELALIQQFESQKGQITQRGLELMNAANTQYEQQRIAAQWEIWRQQNAGYEVAAAAFDSFAGNASNALTGIITGSMSVSEAMRSLGSTVLNSVINSFVQMGVEWLKSVIMGQAGMTAASGMAIAQGQLIAASMAPAAAMTSLATAGANAVPAQAGIASTVGMAQALSIAGARYNGGPVSAGGLYQVGEKGKPEIYQASTGKQYMIPGDNGKVISNKDMQSGGGISVQVNVINQSTGATVQSADGYMQDGSAVVDLLITDIERGGPVSSQMQQTFGLSRKAQGAY
ncbi:phage tape measure protein [Klebsiella pneumoniae]|uniref:tape measure protein n=1 Tax=Klebsiella pneumoniae TaxID=573 RepID=UPI000E2BB3FF|nr:tape measure protein [Klebsiella pneumoniae]MDK7807085.1 tape measure protein [Klebsiella pneumoniae]SVK57544.1 phage tape measure protein [Klebsiella pneumoniae]VGD07782.1 phage tape measure protein [Klebsiella pneumoniae]